MPGLKVVGEVARHGVAVECQQDAPLALAPKKDVRILAAAGKVERVANADGVDEQSARNVVPLDGRPERAGQVFVEDERERHPRSPSGRLRGDFGLVQLGHALA